jgi:hypothetical protein
VGCTERRCRRPTGRSTPSVDIWLNFRLDFARAVENFAPGGASSRPPRRRWWNRARHAGRLSTHNTIGVGGSCRRALAHRVDRIRSRARPDGPLCESVASFRKRRKTVRDVFFPMKCSLRLAELADRRSQGGYAGPGQFAGRRIAIGFAIPWAGGCRLRRRASQPSI